MFRAKRGQTGDIGVGHDEISRRRRGGILCVGITAALRVKEDDTLNKTGVSLLLSPHRHDHVADSSESDSSTGGAGGGLCRKSTPVAARRADGMPESIVHPVAAVVPNSAPKNPASNRHFPVRSHSRQDRAHQAEQQPEADDPRDNGATVPKRMDVRVVAFGEMSFTLLRTNATASASASSGDWEAVVREVSAARARCPGERCSGVSG